MSEASNQIKKVDLVSFRTLNPKTDLNFIFSTWLKGLRYGNEYFELIPSDIFFSHYHKVIENIFSRPQVSARIACFKDDPEIILSYLVMENSTLHWAFTKPPWRRMGLARKLVNDSKIESVTHVTGIGRSILKEGVVFNPFKA